MSNSAHDGDASVLSDMLRRVTRLSVSHPRLTVGLVAISALACAIYAGVFLKFKTDRSDLIDPSAAYHQRWQRYEEAFGATSDIVVVVEAEKPNTIKQVLDRLGTRLQQQPELFTHVLFKVEPGRLRSKGLQYLSPEALSTGLNRVDDYRPILNGRWDLIQLQSLLPRLKLQLQSASARGPREAENLLHHADRLTSSMASFFDDRNEFPNPWPDVVPVEPKLAERASETVYLLSDDGTMGFVMASPASRGDSFEGASEAIDAMRKLTDEVRAEFPGTKIALTGIPVLENDEMRRSAQDSTWASLLSFVGVALITIWGFRGLRHPLLAMLMLGVGMAWSFGLATAVVGHLNILSVSFAAILIGLGCDFSTHILSRYLDLRHKGEDVAEAMVDSAGVVGGGIVTGAITTALAFFCATFTDFLGVAELGIIASGGILACLIATFTFFPAVVVLADQNAPARTLPNPFQGKWLRKLTQFYPGITLGFAIALSVTVGVFACRWTEGAPKPLLKYDHNLLNLQATGLESVETQKRVFESSKHSLLYAISLADSPEEARRLKQKFEALPSVHHVEELATRLPDRGAGETKLLVQAFHAELARLPERPPQFQPVMPDPIGKSLDDLYRFLRMRKDPLSQKVAGNIDRFLDGFTQLNGADQMAFLTEFQYRVAYALLAQFQALADASDPEPVVPADLPEELMSRFVSPQGKWLLQIYPKDQIWDMAPLKKFVTETRSIDPEVTGTPLQNYEAALQIKHSYEVCAIYAMVVILIVLLVDFLPKQHLAWTLGPPLVLVVGAVAILQARRVDWSLSWVLLSYAGLAFTIASTLSFRSVIDTALTMATPICGLLLTFGLMGIFGIPLNPANLIILPLILGIGVDHGVHILHDYHAKPNEVYGVSPSVVNSVILTSATTMVGFGSMMIAAHRGLYSLGAVLTIGVGMCLFVSLVPVPALLAVVSRRRNAAPAAAGGGTVAPAGQRPKAASRVA